jgi:hypothetical protein
MSVCHDNSFDTNGGELTLAREGSWRPVQVAYQKSGSDGPYTDHPTPGRTHIEIDTTWVNNTGSPQMVMAQVDRAPWLIISTNMQQARFMERYSSAVGVNPRAATPVPTVDLFSAALDNPYAYVFYFVTSRARPTVSYSGQDRGTQWLVAPTRVEAGEGINVRYIVSLFTDGQSVVGGGSPKREAYARWGQVMLWAGPAAP